MYKLKDNQRKFIEEICKSDFDHGYHMNFTLILSSGTYSNVQKDILEVIREGYVKYLRGNEDTLAT